MYYEGDRTNASGDEETRAYDIYINLPPYIEQISKMLEKSTASEDNKTLKENIAFAQRKLEQLKERKPAYLKKKIEELKQEIREDAVLYKQLEKDLKTYAATVEKRMKKPAPKAKAKPKAKPKPKA